MNRPSDIVQELQDRIQRMQGSRPHVAGVPTGFEALDRLLGLKRGTLTEWVGSGEGGGAATLAFAVAANILRQPTRGALIVIDKAGEFYPPGAVQLGVPLERTIVVRPDSPTAALWTWEQSLRCPGSAVTCGWIEGLDDRLYRRLQLAAETGGGLGFLLRRPDCRSTPSWAAARIRVRPMIRTSSDSPERRFHVSLARGRNGVAEAGEVELPGDQSHPLHHAC